MADERATCPVCGREYIAAREEEHHYLWHVLPFRKPDFPDYDWYRED